MDRKLLLFWQNPTSRRWMTVGLLSQGSNGTYTFKYSKSAKLAHERGEFPLFGVMQDLYKTYETDELFPIFKNRLLSKTRPEYLDYLNWLGLDRNTVTDMDELSRSGGLRATDQMQMFPYPENSDGEYRTNFFVHGVRHIPKQYLDRIASLERGDALFLMKDLQNSSDPWALAVRTDDPPELIGYCPSFFNKDFNSLLELVGANKVCLSVSKVNMDAPLQFRLLCELYAPWHDNFSTFADDEFEQGMVLPLKMAL